MMVSRYADRPQVGLWPLGLRDKLPTIPLPLLAQERATLDLQSALHQAYEAAGYADYIYTNAPTPPLQGADAEWVQQVITIQRT
jgi:hypothetical protein